MSELRVEFEIITPLFCGGAQPNERGEFRAASLRGVLRWWLERLRPGAGGLAFGSTESGSPILVAVAEAPTGTDPKPRVLINSGIGYLGYSLDMKPNNRKAVRAATRVTVRLISRSLKLDNGLCRSWISALWCLDRFGGMGTRSRRGFGSVQIASWSGWPETDKLPLAGAARTAAEWCGQGEAGWAAVCKWLTPPASDGRILRGGRAILLKESHRDAMKALDDLGMRYKTHRREKCSWPQRVSFGLPVTNVEAQKARAASRLLLSVVRLGDGYHGLATRLLGQAWEPSVRPVHAGQVLAPDDAGLDGFLDGLGGTRIDLT